MKLYWIDTGWACGGIWVKDGFVVNGAPIFRKFNGQTLEKLMKSYKVILCEEHNDPIPKP